MGVRLILEDEDGNSGEFDLITTFDRIHWWCFDITAQEFMVMTFTEEVDICGY